MKIGDNVVVNNKFAGCFNGKHGTIIAEHIPNCQLPMLMGTQRWEVKFDEPVCIGVYAVTQWDFPEASLMLN